VHLLHELDVSNENILCKTCGYFTWVGVEWIYLLRVRMSSMVTDFQGPENADNFL
jgi:hypothetical protein